MNLYARFLITALLFGTYSTQYYLYGLMFSGEDE